MPVALLCVFVVFAKFVVLPACCVPCVAPVTKPFGLCVNFPDGAFAGAYVVTFGFCSDGVIIVAPYSESCLFCGAKSYMSSK